MTESTLWTQKEKFIIRKIKRDRQNTEKKYYRVEEEDLGIKLHLNTSNIQLSVRFTYSASFYIHCMGMLLVGYFTY